MGVFALRSTRGPKGPACKNDSSLHSEIVIEEAVECDSECLRKRVIHIHLASEVELVLNEVKNDHRAPFPFLKIDNGVWNKCAMPGTHSATHSGAVSVPPRMVCLSKGAMFVAGIPLYDDNQQRPNQRGQMGTVH